MARMKTSTALKRTKAKLWGGEGVRPANKQGSICYAACRAGDSAYEIVTDVVMRLLKPYAYLGGWLEAHHNIDASLDPVKYQRTRHAWLDHLIEHYESIGD